MIGVKGPSSHAPKVDNGPVPTWMAVPSGLASRRLKLKSRVETEARVRYSGKLE